MAKFLPSMMVAVAAVMPLAHGQVSQAPFSITISADANVFRVGSEVRIRLILTNTSSSEIPYARTRGSGVEYKGELFSEVEVLNAKGESARETEFYRSHWGKSPSGLKSDAAKGSTTNKSAPVRPKARIIDMGSFTGGKLKPGESREEDIVVNKLYDLSQPGQYTITAMRGPAYVRMESIGKFVARSNTLTISIIE